jgi:PAS domain S-box-containing protein
MIASSEQVTPGCGVPPDELVAGPGRPSLYWISSARADRLGQSFRLDADEITVGRAGASDVVVDDLGASRKHARLAHTPEGEWILTDTGSTNGTYVNGVKIRSTPLREGDKIQLGTVTAFRFSFREALEEREDRLARALRATGIGAFDWNRTTRDVALSGGAERLLAEGRGFWASVHPNDRDRLAALLDESAATSRRFEGEFRLAGPDGVRWYMLRGEPFQGADGAVTHVAGSLVDVTTRKLAEAELRRQAALFESLLDAVVVMDLQGQVIDWNRRAEGLFGHAKRDVVGRRADELLGPTPTEAARAATVLLPLPGEPSGSREVTLRRKDGREVVAELVVVPLKDAAGRHVADVAIYRDVTERKQLEARLRLADRMAALGTLAAGVAHEINNPLAFVLGNIVFLEGALPRAGGDAAAPPELTNALADAKTGAERIRATVRDLLDLARAREAEAVTDVDVNAALEFTLKVAEPQFRHRARLVKRLDAVPPVAAPESRLGQVFMNLVINAAHAIPEGEPAKNEVRIATRFDPETESVVIEVSDTGCGIAPEDQRRIFDPFFTTKPVGQGTGLGLSICHSIVGSLGGDIHVDSAPGRGATFRVRLPASAMTARTIPAAEAARAAARRRILVVDDEPMVASVLQRLLGRRHEVVTASRASEALLLLRAGARFDAILSDLLMPEMTGMELFEKLRAELPDQAARMVFMTGGAYTDLARAFVSRQKARVIPKPIDLEELERVLQQLAPADRSGRGKGTKHV